jgi:hypothetical protein
LADIQDSEKELERTREVITKQQNKVQIAARHLFHNKPGDVAPLFISKQVKWSYAISFKIKRDFKRALTYYLICYIL